ncbi:MAG: hypothetical protein K6B45_09310 [Bacteroidaceae bacterium]|nr:hypothetical protein [Bacteroidaceae bacterium]
MSDLKIVCGSVATPLMTATEFNDCLGVLMASYERLLAELAESRQSEANLREEAERLRNDPWASRVTYDNVVEQIAACEDPHDRDDARRIFEPMLKRDMVRRFRADIRRKAMEMHEPKAPPVSIITLNNAHFDGPMNEITDNDNVNIGNHED